MTNLCPHCGQQHKEWPKPGFYCHGCGYFIPTTSIIDDPSKVLKRGDIVKIINEEHPWRNDIALILEVKHKFYSIEVHSKRTLVPYHWVELYEPSETN